MVKHRGISTLVGAIVLSAVSLAAGWQVHGWLYGLPDAATADREGLLRWLVIADLGEHDDSTCRVLVDRFEAEFADDSSAAADLAGDASTLSAQQREQVAANVERLKQVWFHDRVERYLARPADERAAFMDRQIAVIFRCAAIDRQFNDGGGSGEVASDSGAFVGDFFASLGRWQGAAPEGKRDEISSVVKDGLIRWLATDDLATQSPAIRRQVVAGLEKELGEKLSFGDSTSLLSAAESDTFWRNVEVLAEAWFHVKATEFAALAPAARGPFVARQLAVVGELAANWPSASKNGVSQSGATEIARRMQRWIASTSERERQAAREFAGALQGAWIARTFKLGQ